VQNKSQQENDQLPLGYKVIRPEENRPRAADKSSEAATHSCTRENFAGKLIKWGKKWDLLLLLGRREGAGAPSRRSDVSRLQRRQLSRFNRMCHTLFEKIRSPVAHDFFHQ
jgi:hypothetical protein